jgi:hypothetical protein
LPFAIAAPPLRGGNFSRLLFIFAFAFRTAGVSPAPLPLPPFENFNLKFLPAPAPEARHNSSRPERPGKKTSAKRHRLFTLSFEGRGLTRASLPALVAHACVMRLRFRSTID